MRVELPLVGPSYTDETTAFAAEECINWFPEKSGTVGSRARYILRTHAGLTDSGAEIGGAVRGARQMGGILYVVAGESLYSVDAAGESVFLGTIAGSSRCVLTDNFIPNTKRQLVIFTGERGYVYDTLTGFVEITDPDFLSAARKDTGTFVDGYIIAATLDGFIYSEITDATSWNALDFVTAESATDMALAVWSIYGDVWVFGGSTIEIYRNVGDAGNPFQRIQTIQKGIGAKYSPANVNNSLFWIDEHGQVFTAKGFGLARVSTHAIEQYLASVDFSGAFGFTFVDRGHEFYAFTVPGGKTFLYDIATGLWSRRVSEGYTHWRVSCHALCYGKTYFGDSVSSFLWTLDRDKVGEGSNRLIRERVSAYVHEDGAPLFTSTFELMAETGNAATSTDPMIELTYSDDGGKNWKNWRARSVGKTGEYRKRIRWHRLGMSRQRAYRLRISDPVRCDLITAVMDASVGDTP